MIGNPRLRLEIIVKSLELESKSMSLESSWNRKHWICKTLELELESHDAGTGIRIKIFGQRWNRNQNWYHLLLEPELEL